MQINLEANNQSHQSLHTLIKKGFERSCEKIVTGSQTPNCSFSDVSGFFTSGRVAQLSAPWHPEHNTIADLAPHDIKNASEECRI